MLQTVSMKIALALGSQLHSNREQVEVYAYGLQILLGSALKIVLLVLISIFLNILPYTLLVLAAFVMLRIPGGGVHLNSYSRCLTVGLILILGLAKAAESWPISQSALLAAVVAVLVLALLIIILWVPAGSEKKRFTDPQIIKSQKIKTAASLLIWWSVSIILIFYGFTQYGLALTLGALLAILFISPPGYYIMHKLEKILSMGKEVKLC